jgi:hypothetical protein
VVQGVTFEGGFVLHLTSLIHSSSQNCKILNFHEKSWPLKATYGQYWQHWPELTAVTGQGGPT